MKKLVLLFCLAPLSLFADTELYWGDLHVHSNRSPDSFAFGNSRLTPDAAFRFAKGEKITANSGAEVQLKRPLDFLLVADHAEFVGIFPKLIERDPEFAKTRLGRRWIEKLDQSEALGEIVTEWARLIADATYEQELSEDYRRGIWHENIAFADRHNDPGKFTAFIGYEWTAMIRGNNLHRVVIYRDDADRAGKLPPFSSLDSQNPEDLWDFLERYERTTGGRIMAIPHNGNVSNGMMFELETVDGRPIDNAWAKTRIRWEPVYEVTQVKGDGEAHPFLSPDDEFADFETWDADNINRSEAKTPDMLEYEYARSALKVGLEVDAALGTNPYEFGMIGSTDNHTTLSTADENNFWGKFLDSEKTADRLTNKMGHALWYNWKLAASGYMAAWAEENTRTGLFDALQRREVYASTGPRIALRFFGGWSFDAKDLKGDIAAIGYDRGVPMGSRLNTSNGKPPAFIVQALKDPDGANLDRVQIIKGYLSADGEAGEKIYNVAFAGKRKVDDNGKLPPVGSTVNEMAATYTNDIGEPILETVWSDPDFDPAQRAFYYVRVLEIPTPRWSAYDRAEFNLTDYDPAIPMVTQERVYSSPIWYYP